MKRFWGFVAILIILFTYANLAPTLFRLSDGRYIDDGDAALPFDSDEAIHAMDGLQIAADIYRRNIPLLLQHLYFTYWYPPGLSLYLAPFFIALTPTYWSARYPILLLTMIYLALIYRVAKVLSRRALVGGVAVVLAATSPVIWVHSLLCMEEMLAMVGMLGVVFIYTRHREAHPIWLGLCMALTLLVRLPWVSVLPLLCLWRSCLIPTMLRLI
jgi:4-amino-4-deoxy-L-arabinose transferase-like glycosyltransferase